LTAIRRRVDDLAAVGLDAERVAERHVRANPRTGERSFIARVNACAGPTASGVGSPASRRSAEVEPLDVVEEPHRNQARGRTRRRSFPSRGFVGERRRGEAKDLNLEDLRVLEELVEPASERVSQVEAGVFLRSSANISPESGQVVAHEDARPGDGLDRHRLIGRVAEAERHAALAKRTGRGGL